MFYRDILLEERPNFHWWGWWPDCNGAGNHLYPPISYEAWKSEGANERFYPNDLVDERRLVARGAPDNETYLIAIAETQQIVARNDLPATCYAQSRCATSF